MSFEVLVFVVTSGEQDHFDRAIVERAFADIAVNQIGDYWNLWTPDGEIGFATISIDDQPKISGFGALRPPSYSGFPRFWDAMFEILAQTRTILCWPGTSPYPHYCLANLTLIPDLPDELKKAMGDPAIVSSGAEIDAAITLTGN